MRTFLKPPLFTPDEINRLMRFSKDRRDSMIKDDIRRRLANPTLKLLSAHDKREYLLHSINIAKRPADDIFLLCIFLTAVLAIYLWGYGPLLSIIYSLFIFAVAIILLAKIFPCPERPLLEYYKEALGEIEGALARNEAENAQRVDIERAQLRNKIEGSYQEMINKPKSFADGFPIFQELSNR